MRKGILFSLLLLTAVPGLMRAETDNLAARMIRLLEKTDLDSETLSFTEQELLGLIYSTKFDPVPLASHRQYLDQISDFSKGEVTRTYYDSSGAETHSETKKIDGPLLRHYVGSLVRIYQEGTSRDVFPEIVHVFALTETTD